MEAVELMARAHERCPYSVATRGNIEVMLTVDGLPLGAGRQGARQLTAARGEREQDPLRPLPRPASGT